MSYSKGPWRVKKAFGELWVGTEDEDIAYIEQDASDEENLANAKLMASAPVMLEFIKEFRQTLESTPNFDYHSFTPWIKADYIIQQAEGGE